MGRPSWPYGHGSCEKRGSPVTGQRRPAASAHRAQISQTRGLFVKYNRAAEELEPEAMREVKQEDREVKQEEEEAKGRRRP